MEGQRAAEKGDMTDIGNGGLLDHLQREDTAHKTRGRRITKTLRRGQAGNQSPPKTRERRRMTYTKERASRRLAGQPPGFARHGHSWHSIRRPCHGPRRRGKRGVRCSDWSRKSIMVAISVKPQGISKFKKRLGTGAGPSRRRASRMWEWIVEGAMEIDDIL